MDQRYERSQAEQLEFIEAGPPGGARGRPVLFVHGAFAGAWCWREHFLPYFAERGLRACALSLRGHGSSPGRERLAWHSIGDYVEDLQQAVERVGGDAILVGHSMGGFVVQKYLERAAAPAVVLMAPVPPQGLLPASLMLALTSPGLFADINAMLQRGHPKFETIRHALFAGPVSLDALRAYSRLLQPESQRAIWDMSLFDLPQLWRVRRPPLLVLGAERDVLVPQAQVQLAARFYGTQAEMFPGTGHMMMLEAGWQKSADRIIEWVEGLQLA
jgi:pimeloyl-ACP methyl ester carboxylesterase